MVVLWDIDGTLVRSSLERYFFAYLRQRHPGVSVLSTILHVLHNGLWSWPPVWYKMKVAYLRGLTVDEVDDYFARCWSERIEDNLFPGCTGAVQQLRQRHIRQVLLTGGPRPLAKRVAQHLGVDDLIAADPVITNSRYTGAVTEPHPRGKRKVAFADRWLRQNKLDWKQTVALGNHLDDRYLLERATIAVAVNPDNQLRQLADRKGWPCIDPDGANSADNLVRLILSAETPKTGA